MFQVCLGTGRVRGSWAAKIQTTLRYHGLPSSGNSVPFSTTLFPESLPTSGEVFRQGADSSLQAFFRPRCLSNVDALRSAISFTAVKAERNTQPTWLKETPSPSGLAPRSGATLTNPRAGRSSRQEPSHPSRTHLGNQEAPPNSYVVNLVAYANCVGPGRFTRFGQMEEYSRSFGMSDMPLFKGGRPTHAASCMPPCMSLHVTCPPAWHFAGSPYPLKYYKETASREPKHIV